MEHAEPKNKSKVKFFLKILLILIATISVLLSAAFIFSSPNFIFGLFNAASENESLSSSLVTNIDVVYQNVDRHQKIITLDQLWTVQNSLYQTLISFLIAINGLLGVISFFYIRESSAEKARDSAFKYSEEYVKSIQFDSIVSSKISSSISQAKDDYEKSTEQFQDLNMVLQKYMKEIESIYLENEELRRHINIISRKVSQIDHEFSKQPRMRIFKGVK